MSEKAEKINTPLVSVIVPNYNYSRYVEEAMKSVRDQKYKPLQLIVIDDCSTDDSWKKILDARPDKATRMRVNSGVASCRNAGLIHADGPLIVFLDSDDMLTEDSIERRVDKFLADPTLDMVHGLAWRYRENGKDGYNKKAVIHDQTVMIKREVFVKHGGFYDALRTKENKEMWFRLGVHPESPVKPKIKAKKFNEFYAFYRKHDKQKHRMRDTESRLKGSEATFNKLVKGMK